MYRMSVLINPFQGPKFASLVIGIVSVIRKFTVIFFWLQVSFDLATLYFYQEKFQQAMKLFESCKNAQVFNLSTIIHIQGSIIFKCKGIVPLKYCG